MTKLQAHRRRRRARTATVRQRRNLAKFIPSSDSDFAFTAHGFIRTIQTDPQAFGFNAEEILELVDAVQEFRSALAIAMQKRTRSQITIAAKDQARRNAEQVVRRFANIIRANPKISDIRKKQLRIKVRKKKPGHRRCPSNPPMLMFVGSGDGTVGGISPGSGSGIHVLKFYDLVDRGPLYERGQIRRAKPDGADRIELFFEFVPPGESIPNAPWERSGWPLYLGSFSKSPIEVKFPIPKTPMLVVYWARWANNVGEVSSFSRTCIARVEGWTSNANDLTAAAQSARLPAAASDTTFRILPHAALLNAATTKLLETQHMRTVRCMIVDDPRASSNAIPETDDKAYMPVQAILPAATDKKNAHVAANHII